MRKIRVLRIINRFNIGGPTYNATFLSAFLGDAYETMLVGGLPEAGESDSLYIVEQYGVKPVLIKEMVRKPNLKNDRLAYNKLKQIILDFKPDIVHTHASKAGALGRRAASSCGVPVIVHTFHGHVFHSYFGQVKTEIFKRIERKLAKKSHAIIAISEIQKKELSEIYKICAESKISVIPLGFDLDQFREKKLKFRSEIRKKYQIENDAIAIAIIGRLAPIKNHLYFLEVLQLAIDKTNKTIKCFIVGDGTERVEIEKAIKEMPKKGNNSVLLTSWITDIGEFNAGMDIICLSSKNEGTPVSLIEAQASGIPVVTTEVGGVRDVVKDGETGYIVPLENKGMFVDRLLKLIESEETRSKMSQNGWNYVKDKFHYTSLIREMDKLYRVLLDNGKDEY